MTRLHGSIAAALAVSVIALVSAQTASAPETMTVRGLGTVTIYRGASRPEQVVLFLSGDGGWNSGVVSMAQRLRDAGALVAGIDVRAFMKSMNASSACAYPAAALEELSRAVQLRYKLPAYKRPILVGYSSGATLAYGAIVAAPPETFAGAISLGFCPDIALTQPPCRMRGLTAVKRKGAGYDLGTYPESTVPWMVLQGDIDRVCDPEGTRAFIKATGSARLFWLPGVGHGFGVPAHWVPQFLEAYRAVADAQPAREVPKATAPAVADLSLVEVPVTGGADRNTLVVLLSGDGGWADIDKNIAAGLAKAGVPVVGWSSLDYYWTPRTPDSAASDLARIIDHYTTAWRKSRVLVAGYSFGADVAPFLVNRLPAASRSHVAELALLGPSSTAAFEFHLTDWLGGGADPRYPTRPEIERLGIPVTCVYGSDELESVCRLVRTTTSGVRPVTLGEGHHFSGQYDRLVRIILREETPAG
jgi:type IV secretory pathway VirJ component